MNIESIGFILFCVTLFFALIQIFYYLFFFSRIAFYKKQKHDQVGEPSVPISLIICAFNEEANLKKNLPLWLNQNYSRNGKPYFEVLVVNDNSEDDTFYYLNVMKEQYPHLHIVNLTQDAKLIPGKKFPLSMGIKSARFDYLLLTDADCTPSSDNWMRKMASGFAYGKEIVLGYGPYEKYEGWLNKKIRWETLHSAVQYLSFAKAGLPYMGVGRNLAYHRSLFVKNKGFSSHHHIISGDDDLFINQVATSSNTSVVIHDEAFTISEPKHSDEHWHFQKSRHLSTGKYYKSKHKFLLGMYAMSHFLFWLSLIPHIYWYSCWPFVLIVFAIRWIVQWGVFAKCCINLKENDLIPFIAWFDIWNLFYNIRKVPAIFFKTKVNWK